VFIGMSLSALRRHRTHGIDNTACSIVVS